MRVSSSSSIDVHIQRAISSPFSPPSRIESPRCSSKVRTDTMRQAARVGQRGRFPTPGSPGAIRLRNRKYKLSEGGKREREREGERETERERERERAMETRALFPRKNHKSSPAAVSALRVPSLPPPPPAPPAARPAPAPCPRCSRASGESKMAITSPADESSCYAR